ncbi:MAG: hypothetical protein PVG99_07445 [Desulfobacteraceae bacterium]|jgi:hypothetical protein
MNEKTEHDELEIEIERKHFARAALLASSLGVSEEEVRDLQIKALWQMSAEFRNAFGTRQLADQYGLSKKQVEELLESHATAKRQQGELKALEPCYDHGTGKYLAFEEWLDYVLKNWNKLSISVTV